MGQVIAYGVIVGAVYGLVAVGLALVLGVMRYLNVAHGSLIMIGGYVSFWLFSLFNIDPFVSIPAVMVVMFCFGLAIYKGIFSRVSRLPEGLKINNSMLVTFGLVWVLDNVVTLLWTPDVRGVTTFYSGDIVALLGLRIPYISLGALITALVSIYGLHLFLNRTYFGKSVRATAQDWEAASLMGVNVQRTHLIAFGMGAALASVAGAIIVVNYSITPSGGLEWLLKGFVVVALAGFGSIRGVFAAGLLLGVVEGVSVYLVGATYREVIGLIMFVAILMIRPRGLFTRKAI
ncbi:MAG: branched-chain amino acid ABC transporter permease [Thermodesulfobacteriota bacterium]